MSRSSIALLAVGVILAACGREQPDESSSGLPALGADPEITVSGISSGGYMAGQYQVAFSTSVGGAAIVAAGPWGCSQGEMNRALNDCLSGEGVDVGILRARAAELASAGNIDPLDGLDTQRLFFFLGAGDPVIKPALMEATMAFLIDDASEDRATFVNDVAATHGWVTAGRGTGCDTFESPYVNDCDFDLAGAILEHLYGELSPAVEAAGELVTFDQAAFGDADLAETGFAYVPVACRDASCRVHVFFHGCEQSADTIGTQLIDNAGFNEWAESNRTIVLYPQVAPSQLAPLNPLGCWDWWGYSGDNYLHKDAPQLAAVRAMVDRLTSAD